MMVTWWWVAWLTGTENARLVMTFSGKGNVRRPRHTDAEFAQGAVARAMQR